MLKALAVIETANADNTGNACNASVEKKSHPKMKCPDLKVEVLDQQKGLKVMRKECNVTMA